MNKPPSNNVKFLQAESRLVSAAKLKLVKPLKTPAEIESKFQADRKLITLALKKISPSFQLVANQDFEIEELANVLSEIAEISARAQSGQTMTERRSHDKVEIATQLAPTLLG